MARECKVCAHSRVTEIDALLLAVSIQRPSFRNISKHYALSPAAVFRHAKEHLPIVPSSQPEAPNEPKTPAPSGDIPAPAGTATVALSASEAWAAGNLHGGGRITTRLLTNHLALMHAELLDVLKAARQNGRIDTALKAHRESRADVELIARMHGLLKDGARGEISLRDLSSVQLAELLRANLAEVSARDRADLALECPEIVTLLPEQFQTV